MDLTKMFLSSMIIIISIFMIFLTHPLSMGFMILIQTFILSMLTGMFMKTYWFSYILMLTFLGGLLVLFIYVSSVASNELFKFSFKMKFLSIFMIFLIMMFFFYKKNNLIFMNFYFNNEMNNFFNIFFFNNENKMNLSKLYNNQTYLIMLILVIYLFITLMAVVKITNIFFGTLRSSI